MNAAAVRRTRAGRTLSAWSAVTAVMGLVWAAGGPGFPFAGGFRAARMGAVLPDLDPLPAGLAVTALGLAGVWAADKRAVRYLGPPVAVLLLLIVPDGRLLLAVGELLVGDPGRVEAAAPAQAWFAAGGVLWAWPAGVSAAPVMPNRWSGHGR
ncbi:hypothetical protein [Actinoplanes sp. G11-F43]|uniref:hypothetical protein n=1 Tax=Actinoplanes sp. G11-F43 TaxID=3424130 RepID=UPI003D34B1D2